jgi:hypothetical protein
VVAFNNCSTIAFDDILRMKRLRVKMDQMEKRKEDINGGQYGEMKRVGEKRRKNDRWWIPVGIGWTDICCFPRGETGICLAVEDDRWIYVV